MTLWLDIETFSCTPITAGVYRYTEDPTFEILMCAWATELHGPVEVAIGEDEIERIPGIGNTIHTHVAHNAAFERICFSRMWRSGSSYDPPFYWRDTAAIAGQLGYPQKLEKLAPALGVEGKDPAGTRLINFFCKPDRFGRRNMPEDHPEKWAQFVEYCRQDVVTLMNVDEALGQAWPNEAEHAVWLADQAVNDRGFRIDVEMARQAAAAVEDNHMVQELEISHLTGIANPGSQPQLLAWLKGDGVKIGNLSAEVVTRTLARGGLTETQERVLRLRQELAGTASKKYTAALDKVSEDGRVRGGFRFFGAHTGRWSGSGFQPHNLPKASFTDEDGEWDPVAEAETILDLMMGNGASAEDLKKLVRPLILVDGVVVDYAAIEARVLAWMADEQWALEAFRAGRDIYTETAQRMGGLTRSQGKVAVLALGYNGGIGSLNAMGAQGNDEQLQSMVNQWRRANPSIVRLWRTMEGAFRHGGPVGRHLTVERVGTSRFIRLPSGRAIGYHGCQFGDRIRFKDPRRGFTVDTYGGRLIENVTQGIARDVLAEALVRLEAQGFSVVAHVHDEVVTEGSDDLELVTKIMTEQPVWADGLPIDGEGFRCSRYRKG